MSAPAVVNLTDSPVAWDYLRNDPPTIEGDTESGWSGTLDLVCAASDWVSFLTFLAGSVVSVDIGGGTIVQRIIPCSHPVNSKLLCTKLSGKVTGEWTAGNPDWLKQFSKGRVKATFTSVPYLTDGSTPFMIVNGEEGSESYTLAGTRLAFASGEPVNADAAVAVPTQVYSVEMFQCVGPGDDTYLPLIGKVSSTDMTLKSFLCPAGTVKLDNAGFTQTMTAGLASSYTRRLKLSYRPIPWNYFLKPSGDWDLATNPVSGDPVYQSADLTVLFQ